MTARVLSLRGRLDQTALELAWLDATSVSAWARDSLREVDGRIDLVRGDAPHLSFVSAPAAEVEELVREQLLVAFDLATGPCLRATALHHSDLHHTLLVVGHQALVSDEGLAALTIDLASYYSRRVASKHLMRVRVPEADTHVVSSEDVDAPLGQALSDWVEELGGACDDIDWPRRSSGGVGTAPSGHLDRVISVSDVERLIALSEQLRVAWSTVLLALMRAILLRYLGRVDVLVAFTTSDHPGRAALDAPGWGDDMLITRHAIDPHDEFAEFARALEAGLLERRSRPSIPLSVLGRTLRPRTGSRRSGLTQVGLSCADGVASVGDWAHLKVHEVAVPVGVAEFELGLRAVRHDSEIRLRWTFDTVEHGVADVANLADWFAHGLDVVLGHPEASLADLVVVVDRQPAPFEVSQTGEPLLPHLVSERAVAIPHDIAVCSADAALRGPRQLSYAELESAAAAVAAGLRSLELPRQSAVGVAVGRGTLLPAVILGVLRAGMICVPLVANHPPERLRQMLEDAAVTIVVVDDGEVLPAAACPTIGLQSLMQHERLSDAPPVPEALLDPDDLAYVLFTSGSSGRPKGAGITHRGLANCLVASREDMALQPGTSLLALTNISFDIAMLELFLPLVSGGRAVIASREQAADPVLLEAVIAAEVPDVVQATPLTWQMLMSHGWPGCPGLTISCGGDTVSPRLAARLMAGTSAVWHTYGPTEATLYTALGRLARHHQHGPLPLDHPLAGTYIRILDENLRVVPEGVVGEVCIGGCGLARGYVGRPGLTAAGFVPDPHGDGDRIYRTGDLGRWRPDGGLELHGRNDRQLKVRGHRIEPAEVEAVLSSHPDVDLAAVCWVVPHRGAGRLTAFLQLAAGVRPDATLLASVRRHVADRLGVTMSPETYAAVDPMPIQVNGKIDRRALSVMTQGAGDVVTEASDDVDEARVRKAWARVFDADVVEGTDFFDVGGDAELALRLRFVLRERFGVDLSLTELVSNQTIGSQARLLRRAELASQLEAHRGPGWLTAGLRPLIVIGSDGSALPAATGLVGEEPTPWRIGALDASVEDVLAGLVRVPNLESAVLLGWGTAAAMVLGGRQDLVNRAGHDLPVVLVDAPPATAWKIAGGSQVGYVLVDGPEAWLQHWRQRFPGLIAPVRAPRDSTTADRILALASAIS